MSAQHFQRQPRFTLPRHRGLVREACGAALSTSDLLVVESANLAQDLWQTKSEFHFDNCAFDEAIAWYQEQWEQVRAQAASRNRAHALSAFGKILHLIEDFYSHTNWVELQAPQGAIPLWDMRRSSLPQGITSGTYGLGTPKRCRGGTLSHDQLNKDDASSPRGSQTVPEGALAGRSYYELAYDAALRHSQQEVARLMEVLEPSARGEPAPGEAEPQPVSRGRAMADQWVKVRVTSIHVEKSESYGWFGEPGVEAEWRLTIDVNGNQRVWVNDHVRDRRDYSVGWDFYAGPLQSTSILTVRTTGYELDDCSANDGLPTGERSHNFGENWGIGTQSLSAADDDFNYILYYEVSLLRVMQISNISRKQVAEWMAERRAKRGFRAELKEEELATLFINKALHRGYRLISMDRDVLVFEGPAPIQAFVDERLPFAAEQLRKRFPVSREPVSAPLQ